MQWFYLSGGSTFTENFKFKVFDNIIELNTESETWETVAKLRNPRGGHGSSIVRIEDYRNYVLDCKTNTGAPAPAPTATPAPIATPAPTTVNPTGPGVPSNAEFCDKDQGHTMCKYTVSVQHQINRVLSHYMCKYAAVSIYVSCTFET